MRRPAASAGAVGLLLLAAVLVLAIALGDRDTPLAESASSPGGPSVTPDDARSTAWFCAEGTSNADGRAAETVLITNLATDEVAAEVTVFPGGEEEPATLDLTVDGRSTLAVPVADVLATPEPGVMVEVFGGDVLVEHQVRSGDDVAVGPCASEPGTEWYFASGTTSRGAEQYLALFNPFGEDATVDIAFVTDTGFSEPERLQGLTVPRWSRVSVPVHDEVRRRALVGTAVSVRSGRVVAEQSLLLDGSDDAGGRQGIAVSLGASAPARDWHFPWAGVPGEEGQGIAVANFDTTSGEVTVAVTLEGNATLPDQTVPVPPRTVVVIDLAGRVPGEGDASLSVHATGDVDVVAEQLVVGNDGIATMLGATRAAERWAFSTRGRAVALVNPGADDLAVVLRGADGTELTRGDVAAGQRLQIEASDLEVPASEPVLVDANGPVVAVRIGTLTVSPGVIG